jgi:uncharacterized protein YndB with AHSA1/START domain
MARVDVTHDFAKPVERVYAYLAESENLEELFGARITRVRDGDTSRNGTGAVRSLKLPAMPAFEETVTEAVPNELVEYRITRGSPLRDHVGRMRFSRLPNGGTRLHYVIEFGAVVPGLAGVVARGLDQRVRKALPKVDERA